MQVWNCMRCCISLVGVHPRTVTGKRVVSLGFCHTVINHQPAPERNTTINADTSSFECKDHRDREKGNKRQRGKIYETKGGRVGTEVKNGVKRWTTHLHNGNVHKLNYETVGLCLLNLNFDMAMLKETLTVTIIINQQIFPRRFVLSLSVNINCLLEILIQCPIFKVRPKGGQELNPRDHPLTCHYQLSEF
ncbi:hypothetical protein F2P79_021450 [Pimephales promelas]|nr:hypothetical protein F2P79_021450 [Pimephales promelas]KAG1931821.1 hypothetical protein F2P79_021450 [Pimephales promelas]